MTKKTYIIIGIVLVIFIVIISVYSFQSKKTITPVIETPTADTTLMPEIPAPAPEVLPMPEIPAPAPEN